MRGKLSHTMPENIILHHSTKNLVKIAFLH